jgi:hypothetical protein
VFEDRTASPVTRYGYRLVWSVGPAARASAEWWADMPPPRLALANANPSARGLAVALSLPDAARAQLGLNDLQDRQLLKRDMSGLGPGDHVLELEGPGTLPPGIYLVRLVHGGRSLVVQTSVIR